MVKCPDHMTAVWVRDEDYPSNSNLGMWLLRACLCEACGEDQAASEWCATCQRHFAELVWAQRERSR
jgi:hypothetical protein